MHDALTHLAHDRHWRRAEMLTIRIACVLSYGLPRFSDLVTNVPGHIDLRFADWTHCFVKCAEYDADSVLVFHVLNRSSDQPSTYIFLDYTSHKRANRHSIFVLFFV